MIDNDALVIFCHGEIIKVSTTKLRVIADELCKLQEDGYYRWFMAQINFGLKIQWLVTLEICESLARIKMSLPTTQCFQLFYPFS